MASKPRKKKKTVVSKKKLVRREHCATHNKWYYPEKGCPKCNAEQQRPKMEPFRKKKPLVLRVKIVILRDE